MPELATTSLVLAPGQVPIITREELAIWTQRTITDDDVYATAVINGASNLVADEAKHYDWLDPASGVKAPFRAWMICILVAKRAYKNPDGEVSVTTGPISARVLEQMALYMQLSPEEEDELHRLRPSSGFGGLWTIGITGGSETLAVGYLTDTSGSDWMIPYQDPNDVASDVNP